MLTSLLATIYSSLSPGNVLLLLLLLFLLHYMTVLYEFRNMPPGPRLTTLPVLGNIFSLDFRAEKLTGAFERSVSISVFSILKDCVRYWSLIVEYQTVFFEEGIVNGIA